MAPSREIEKLQRRWQENPLGLTFAPLAEAYRKEGMLADALELLEIGLAQHANYVPAHIVRGRCFLDGRSDSAAETAFSRVLDLDPENVIALKGLADIAERGGRIGEAARRLERLLEVDRSNEEARAQLDRVKAGFVTEVAPAEPVVATLDPEPVVDEITIVPDPVEAEMPRAEIVDAPLDDVEVLRYDPIELSSSESNEYQQPGDSEALRIEEARGMVDELEAPAVVEPVVEAVAVEETVVEPVEAELADVETRSVEADDHAAVAGFEAEPELVVTETMAEVFLRQGHRELALAVYSQLVGRTPDDRRIRDAIARLEAELKPAATPSLPAFSAVLTGGASVRSFFEQLLSATRPRAPEAQLPPGLSLGAVFGEDAGAKAVAAAAEVGPSYDEFYAEEPGSQVEPAGRIGEDEPGPGDDLESFTSWLKGLRR